MASIRPVFQVINNFFHLSAYFAFDCIKMDDNSDVKTKRILPLQLPILFGYLGFGFLWFALPIYSKILGASALENGGMFAVFSLGAGICSFLLPGLPGIFWLAIFWAIESVGWDMAGPAEEAMVADLTGHQKRGTEYGLYTFVSSVGASVGPLVGGWLYDFMGRAVPFYINGIVLLIGALLVLLLLGKTRLPAISI